MGLGVGRPSFTLVGLWQVAFGLDADTQLMMKGEQQMAFQQTVTMGRAEVCFVVVPAHAVGRVCSSVQVRGGFVRLSVCLSSGAAEAPGHCAVLR